MDFLLNPFEIFLSHTANQLFELQICELNTRVNKISLCQFLSIQCTITKSPDYDGSKLNEPKPKRPPFQWNLHINDCEFMALSFDILIAIWQQVERENSKSTEQTKLK